MNYKIPLKRFGQHYLKDDNIVTKIIDEISPKPTDLIVEIGPGEGALTLKLIEEKCKVVAIEIDKRNYELLKQNFPSLTIFNEDFLKTNLHEIHTKYLKPLRVVGNIPYNITSPVLFKMIENRQIIQDSVLMIQHEVAKRLIAKAGTKDYGILSVIMQHFAEVKFCFKVSPNVFFPRPKVYSAVIKISFNKTSKDLNLDSTFIQIVKAAFNKRRKMLYNSFKNSIFGQLDFKKAGINLNRRAEQLKIDEFIELAKFASTELKQNSLIKL